MMHSVCLFVLLVLVDLNDAEFGKTLIYEDMGCKKIESNSDNNLAVAYNCDHVFEDGCSYKNEKYRVGKPLPQSVALLSCSSSCRCKQNGFLCSLLRCPEIGQVTLSNQNCYHIYTLSECCNRGEVCPPFDNIPTCEVDGKKYFRGQIFYPKNTDLHCVCQNDFKGKFVMPFCRNVECGVQLKYGKELKNRCAPMYEKTEPRNCPSSWFCHNDDVIVTNNSGNNSLKCFYGEKILKLGEYFERKQANYFDRVDNIIRCECVVPPLLTCSVAGITPW
ncbi:hypothetical protein RN001_004062 [Aquatica leii]|uniref:VWFC domain-containing protein n=1 Tax=Aquatica leii TaxID=1421715 RepID=A0AAN7SEG3_9COLE|nr:hypothetical protein RN001_004062 [Aquatica leii]